MTDKNKLVYSQPVLDFVTIAAEFCLSMENEDYSFDNKEEWIDKMLKILPLLYLNASLLPEIEDCFDFEEIEENFVKEDDYNHIYDKISRIMGDDNAYLDVFVEDMKYSDTPVTSFISENIADIYQDVRNFVSIYQLRLSDQMIYAISVCKEKFRTYWGQQLVNVLRPLHTLISEQSDNPIYTDETE